MKQFMEPNGYSEVFIHPINTPDTTLTKTDSTCKQAFALCFTSFLLYSTVGSHPCVPVIKKNDQITETVEVKKGNSTHSADRRRVNTVGVDVTKKQVEVLQNK